VWTAHNLLPHEPCRIPSFDRLGRRLVIALSDRVYVHGKSAAAVVQDAFPVVRAKLTVVDHGHWIDMYPLTRTKAQCQEQLGVSPHTYTYGFVGACRPYKNLEQLIAAFQAIHGDLALIVAGSFQDTSYCEVINTLVAQDSRIRLYDRYIPNDELEVYVLACDAIIIPYKEVLTSGAAMLALSFGRPVVSVRRGSLADLIVPEVGVLLDPNDQGPESLAKALVEIRERRFDEHLIRGYAARFRWEDTARAFLAALPGRRGA
jgi:glycosyltransferase involved in cell wall biosynthesis